MRQLDVFVRYIGYDQSTCMDLYRSCTSARCMVTTSTKRKNHGSCWASHRRTTYFLCTMHILCVLRYTQCMHGVFSSFWYAQKPTQFRMWLQCMHSDLMQCLIRMTFWVSWVDLKKIIKTLTSSLDSSIGLAQLTASKDNLCYWNCEVTNLKSLVNDNIDLKLIRKVCRNIFSSICNE